MKSLTLYQVDAFTDKLFGGNPAAVVKLDKFLSCDLMQKLALENNLSETAFVVPREEAGHYDLRWFTPEVEIDFCGHATVATAHVLAVEMHQKPPFHFHAQIGELIVSVENGFYQLDAPVYEISETDITPEMRAAFPVPIVDAFHAGENLYLVFEEADDIRSIAPDMAKVKALSDHGVGITAQSSEPYDCVSRLFFPAIDLNEDPVTGSAHAAIGPYWAKKLGKNSLKARQASRRGGVLYLTINADRITISGQAVTYMKGEFFVP